MPSHYFTELVPHISTLETTFFQLFLRSSVFRSALGNEGNLEDYMRIGLGAHHLRLHFCLSDVVLMASALCFASIPSVAQG